MKFSTVAAEKSAAGPAPVVANATILIVDDEALVRWSLNERLARDGCRVLEAGTARAALEQVDDGVDVMLLDYRLPDASGLAVLRAVKERHPLMPVILMTAYSSVENAVEAINLGAFDYVSKPFDLDDVAAIVGKAVAARRLSQE